VDDGRVWAQNIHRGEQERKRQREQGAPAAIIKISSKKNRRRKRKTPELGLVEEIQRRVEQEDDIYAAADSSSSEDETARRRRPSSPPPLKKKKREDPGDATAQTQVRVYQDAERYGDERDPLAALGLAGTDDQQELLAASSPQSAPAPAPGSDPVHPKRGKKKRNRKAERLREQKRILAQHSDAAKMLREQDVDLQALFGANSGASAEDSSSLGPISGGDYRLSSILESIDAHTVKTLSNTMSELPDDVKRAFRGEPNSTDDVSSSASSPVRLVVLPEPKTFTERKAGEKPNPADNDPDDVDYVPEEEEKEREGGEEEEQDAEEQMLAQLQDESDSDAEERHIAHVLAAEGIVLPKPTAFTQTGTEEAYSSDDWDSQDSQGSQGENAAGVGVGTDTVLTDAPDDVPDTPITATVHSPIPLTQPEGGDTQQTSFFQPAPLTFDEEDLADSDSAKEAATFEEPNVAKLLLAKLAAAKKQKEAEREDAEEEEEEEEAKYKVITAEDLDVGNDTGSEEEEKGPKLGSLRRSQFAAESECEVSDDAQVSSDEKEDLDTLVVSGSSEDGEEDEEDEEEGSRFAPIEEDDDMQALLRITSGAWRSNGAQQEEIRGESLRDLVFQDDGNTQNYGAETLGDRDPHTGLCCLFVCFVLFCLFLFCLFLFCLFFFCRFLTLPQLTENNP
jgi:hypothetical protein